ncbi:HEXXH motif-containing putative peptide modification protein [Actinoplanes sp. NPDC051851]|uniref:aKG-HExxH-type peptide beta-hydroxylase n=1 Tax=Actinoplanes sp. NPDC051851 TaxID=3154753 RepID=UPI0034148FE2
MTRPFRLADADLAALGAGLPTAGTLGLLRRAQLSRHLLLLREVRRELSETPFWYATLTATGTTSTEAESRIADPMTGLWAAQALTALRAGDKPDELPAPSGHHLRVTHAGMTLAVRLDDSGPLRHRLGLPPAAPLTPDELAHWHTCLAAAWTLLTTRHRAAATTLAEVLRVIVPVQPDPSAEGISATSAEAFGAVAISTPADGRSLAVGLLHETQHSVLNAVHSLFELTHPTATRGYSPWREDPRPPLGVLHGVYAYLAVTRFWRTEAAAHRDDNATAHPDSDAAARQDSDAAARQDSDAAARQDSDATAHPGNLVAAHQGGEGTTAEFEFARWRVAVAEAARELLDGGRLTPVGARFAGALLAEVTAWRDEPVAPETKRLASIARADHRLRWRLRNLLVDPDDTAALAAAWRDHRKPPEVRVRVVPATGRALENSSRLRLIRAWLTNPSTADHPAVDHPAAEGPAQEDTATAGDAACLRGDHESAGISYRRRLLSDPSDDAAWSGLALVSPHPALHTRPEVVRAAALTLPGADPLALAAWL